MKLLLLLSAFNRRLRRNSPPLLLDSSSSRFFVRCVFYSFLISLVSWAALYHCVIDVARVGVRGSNWKKSRLEKKKKKGNKTQVWGVVCWTDEPAQAAYYNRSSRVASSSQLDCCADGEKWHSSLLALPIDETHCGRVFRPFIYLFFFFLHILNSFSKQFRIFIKMIRQISVRLPLVIFLLILVSSKTNLHEVRFFELCRLSSSAKMNSIYTWWSVVKLN